MKVKKVLMIVSALLVLSVIAPAMASATKIPVKGSITAILTVPGEVRITEGNIMIQRDTEAEGPASGDLAGKIHISSNVNLNLNTGKGVAFGTFVFTDAHGTFKGMWRVRYTGFVHFEGAAEGHGNGAYDGMLVKLSFKGLNPPGVINIDYEGIVLSPKGTPLP